MSTGQVPRQVHGEKALCRIQQKGQNAQPAGAGADDIGGADVAAAGLADVLFEEYADQEIAEWNRTKQVTNRGCNPIDCHGYAFECSSGAERFVSEQYLGYCNLRSVILREVAAATERRISVF